MKNIISVIIITVMLISCKDDDLPNSTYVNEIENSYFPMTIGSYWVYKTYRISFSSGDTLHLDEILTYSITKDTLIDNHLFHKFEITSNTSQAPQFQPLYYQSTLGEIYDIFGSKQFSSRDFSDTLARFALVPFYEVIYNMERNWVTKITELGDFVCMQKTGQFKPFSSLFMESEIQNFYAKGIGLIIIQDRFLTTGVTIHRELIDYHIEPQ